MLAFVGFVFRGPVLVDPFVFYDFHYISGVARLLLCAPNRCRVFLKLVCSFVRFDSVLERILVYCV